MPLVLLAQVALVQKLFNSSQAKMEFLALEGSDQRTLIYHQQPYQAFLAQVMLAQ